MKIMAIVARARDMAKSVVWRNANAAIYDLSNDEFIVRYFSYRSIWRYNASQ